MIDDLDIRPGTHLLDVGCGQGLFLRLAAERGATVTGIDADPACIEIAREQLPYADLTVGDMESLPYPDDSFDVVTVGGAFQSPTVLREAARVARPGARIFIATTKKGA